MRLLLLSLALLALPSTAAAQKDQFFDELLPIYRALRGVYGDEGSQLRARVASMAAALERWDAATAQSQAELAAGLRGADRQSALQAHTLLASMALERGRFEEALKEFDADLRLDPQRAAFHRFKGLIYQALGRPADAAAAFRAAWIAEPDDLRHAYYLLVHRAASTTAAQATRARATLATLERELVAGERAAEKAPFLSLRPINDDAGGAMAFAPAAYVRAFSLLLTGEPAAGLTALRIAVSSDPLVAEPALRLEPMARGIAALRDGRIADAIAAIENVLTLAPSSEVHRILATARIHDGDLAAGVQHLRESVRLNPKNERAWLALARALDDGGDWDAAAAVLRTALAELPDAGELRWELSVISGKRQRTDEADLELVATVDLIVLLGGSGELHGRVARLAQAHLDYTRALALLERRVLLTPNNAAAHQALGRAYLDQGRDEEAYAELVIALLLDPVNADTLAAIGRLHLDAGRYLPAIDTLTRATTIDPVHAQAVHALGDALVRAGKTSEGQERLAQSERLQARAVEGQRRSRTASMLSLQADISLAAGEVELAIEMWQQAIALEPQNAATHVRLADALLAAKQLEPAAAALRAAISLRAGPPAHRRLAVVYEAMGRADDSARERRLYREQLLDSP